MANLLLLLCYTIRGLRLKRLCRLGLRVSGTFLLIVLPPLVLFVCTLPTPLVVRLALPVRILLLSAPLAAELQAFAAISLWHRHEPRSPPA